jgi:hypothetical protein
MNWICPMPVHACYRRGQAFWTRLRKGDEAMTTPVTTPAGEGEILLTVMLKHQKDKNLSEINAKLDAAGFWKKFPPEGIEVVS